MWSQLDKIFALLNILNPGQPREGTSSWSLFLEFKPIARVRVNLKNHWVDPFLFLIQSWFESVGTLTLRRSVLLSSEWVSECDTLNSAELNA